MLDSNLILRFDALTGALLQLHENENATEKQEGAAVFKPPLPKASPRPTFSSLEVEAREVVPKMIQQMVDAGNTPFFENPIVL